MLNYTSDNTAVATVDKYGTVVGRGAGTTHITAAATDGSGKTLTYTVSVGNPVQSISLTGTVSVSGGSMAMVSTPYCLPSNHSANMFSLTSSDPTVATWNQYSGGGYMVTGLKKGSAYIYITAMGDGSGVYGRMLVSVN